MIPYSSAKIEYILSFAYMVYTLKYLVILKINKMLLLSSLLSSPCFRCCNLIFIVFIVIVVVIIGVAVTVGALHWYCHCCCHQHVDVVVLVTVLLL